MSAGHTSSVFLCDATRFKLSFSTHGNVNCLWNYAKELDGRWVALVPAEDDVYMKLAASVSDLLAERDRLKVLNAELAAALESVVASRDLYCPARKEKYCVDELSGVAANYWSPSASMVASEAIAQARAALEKHKKETA